MGCGVLLFLLLAGLAAVVGGPALVLFVVVVAMIVWYVRRSLRPLSAHQSAAPPKPQETLSERDASNDRERAIPGSPKELRAMPYKEYLQTPHWKRKREDKLRTVGRRCQVCNHGPHNLDVHHRTYERLGEELDQDLTFLCRACHTNFHENRTLGR